MSKRSTLVPFVFLIAKSVALLAGGVFAVLGLMALAGIFTGSGWARVGIALAVAIIVPAIVADRLLPDNLAKGKGIVTDVFSIAWVGIAFVVIGVLGGGPTRPALAAEADRLDSAGYQRTARLLSWSIGAQPARDSVASKPTPTPVTPEREEVELDAGVVPDGAAEAASEADAGPSTTDEKLSPAKIFERWSSSVVTIQGPTGRYGASGGTGFIVDADAGLIVTNHHVVEGMTNVSVKLIDDEWASEVELLFSDPKLDIAVLEIATKSKLAAVELGDSSTVKVGERAVSIGNPLGLEHTLTDGLVSQRRVLRGRKMIQMSTPISPGNSGGPLFNQKGQVIGVSTASLSGYGRGQNLNLAVPINEVKVLLAKSEYPDRKRVGGGSPTGKGKW
jgi:S1-C subfamily serine protease